MRTLAVVDGIAGGIIVVLCFIFGFLAGRRRSWKDMLINSTWATGVTLMWYASTMISVPDPQSTNDIAAGAGTVMFAVPLFLILLICSGLAALVGRCFRPWRAPAQQADNVAT